MIPVRLVMRNFLSYGEPEPIDFTKFDVACLTGDNGVGKSAFLDAISWALFGAARGCENGQNQDRLIRDRADEATVDFTFTLGDATYRIVRRRTKTKGDVGFMIADGDEWTNIAGETIRETEARISSTLRMDYDTFTASAFFVQGRAEDFLARMKAEQRKEVFASLLDLGVYETLEEKARERARQAETRRVEAATRIERLTTETEDAAIIRAELEAVAARTTELGERAAEAEATVGRIRDELAALGALKAEAEGATKLIATLDADKRRTEALAASRRAELTELDGLLTRIDEIGETYKELEGSRAAEEEARTAEREAAKLREREASIRAQITAEHDATQQRITEGTRTVAALRKERAQLERADAELAKVVSALEDVSDAPDALADARRQIAELRAEEARLAEAMRGLDARTAELEEHASILGRGGGECPVCGTSLDASHRKQAQTRLRADLRALASDRTKHASERDVVRKEMKRCAEDVARLTKADAERERLATTAETLRGRLERLPIVIADIDALQTQIDTDAKRLTDGIVAPALEAELTAISKQRSAIYDADAHDRLRARIEELRPAEELWLRVTHAAERRPVLDDEIRASDAHVAEIESQIAEHRRALAELEERLVDLPRKTEELRAADEALRAVQAEVHGAGVETARLEERLAAAERTAAELDAARTEELAAATESRRYGRLVQAFGRNGIPALVMDNVLPDLTEEANDLLGELSNYEMYVQFDLKRQTKTGKEKDTFDVRVHHAGGQPRDFAMFSGGEAFRIAFAVRLAMSKLLVRRAGARLETLVIDEGFGTQDPEGRERLISAIQLAQREFRKVLVITHLDDLKDAFATQIRVTKDDDRGSVLEVVGA
jgi:exonuclease SbcC